MKRVIFIRHNKLVSPYGNYSSISLDDLSELALLKIDPQIADISLEDVKSNMLLQRFGSTDLIITSNQTRTKQTAKKLQELFNKDVPTYTTPFLNEIVFDPAKLVSVEKYKTEGMKAVREAFFRAAVSNSLDESIYDIFSRTKELKKYLIESKYKNIVCITHGFYMRFIYIAFSKANITEKQVMLEDLMEAPKYSNLVGFMVNLNRFGQFNLV